MGNEIIGGVAQPIDIMTLEETTSNTTTVQPILNMLNGDYAGADYQMSTTRPRKAAVTSTATAPTPSSSMPIPSNLVASVGVGTPERSSNGEYRQVVRYEFQPVEAVEPTASSMSMSPT